MNVTLVACAAATAVAAVLSWQQPEQVSFYLSSNQ